MPRRLLRHAGQGKAQPCQKGGLLLAVQTCAGTFGAAAFALPSRVTNGPLARNGGSWVECAFW